MASWTSASSFRPRPYRYRPADTHPSLFDQLDEPTHAPKTSDPKSAQKPTSTPLVKPPPENALFTDATLPAATQPVANTAIPSMASGEKTKARDILAAIRIVNQLHLEHRPANADERQTLARFGGFGPVALSLFPDPVTGQYKDGNWQALGEELAHLLAPADYASAKRSTFNAFYTSHGVIAVMHQALERLGVPRDGLVLEPGCGSGNFLSLAPPGLRFIGVELDQTSGRIAQALHPHQDIRIENFRDTRLGDNALDAVVGNVPFADLKLDYRGRRFSLHDYFFAKSVDALKPGGVLALVTSHFTLDKRNAAIREYLAERADFIGAIRLPSDAFKREGTAVVTDIVFLRKRAVDQSAKHADPVWLAVGTLVIEDVHIGINQYFLNHPEMVLGTWSRQDTLYGGDDGYSVCSDGDLERQLAAAIGRLPERKPSLSKLSAPAKSEPPVAAFTPPPPLPHVTEGSFFVSDDGVVRQIDNGQTVVVEYGGVRLRADGSLTGRRIAKLIALRDLARRVLQSQNEGWPEGHRVEARRALNRAYDGFVQAFGPINKTTIGKTATNGVIRRMPNLVKFREDPDAMLVMSLENYDESIGQAVKAAILLQDVVGHQTPITTVRSAEEGLLVSLDRRGVVDLDFIAELYGQTTENIVAELNDLIYCDPENNTWQTADAYLSGNVRNKLTVAEASGPEFHRNVAALRTVQPEDVLPGDIEANLGAPWIPESDIHDFATELFRVAATGIQVGHLKKDAVWTVVADYDVERSVAATTEFGTARANGAWLLELALNMKTPVLYDTVQNNGRDERVVNQEATLAAKEKQKIIKERFRLWVFADAERTERLVRIYNDAFNNLRPRLFDGSHLDFPGMNRTIQLNPHQEDAVWRGMSGGNTLLAHAVGAGKTYTMAATGMKLRQAGLITKPLFVVPNHMLEQFAREFMQLYPNAHLLVAAKEDLARDRRKLLTAKIASGDWDGVIVTHSSFERIGMSRIYQERFLCEQIADYDQLLREAAAANASRAHRNLIKTIEKQKAQREERLKDLLAEEKKDDGLVFDELGVDHLFVDEAQFFKNLETPTKMERVAGIQTGGSERAFDLYMKARYLDERHAGHGVVFATGTPISNTMVELYTLQRFLDPKGLVDRGIEHFDAWAATFGEVVDTMEISPDGASLRARSRFAKFTNLPELQQMFRAFTDVQTAAMLDLPRPQLKTGKPIIVACPMSEIQADIQKNLVERYERIRSQRVDPREDNALAITTDGRKLALDARLLSTSSVDHPGCKINALAERVTAIWRESVCVRGTQMIFCDIGVHPTAWGFSVYDAVIVKLIDAGIAREQIAAIGDADSDLKKQALFDKVRTGSVRVLLGSTQKMGTGTNVQQRLVALHHLDAPWKPAEVEQREGRILRQGNANAEVAIYRYVTEGSFDAYMWQALETKARFIAQIMTGEVAGRRAEDIGGQELSYAEVKAIASGNPAVLTLAEADAELQRLAVLKRNHTDEQFIARRNLKELPGNIARMQKRLAELTADGNMATARQGDPIVVGGKNCRSDSLMEVLAEQLKKLPTSSREPRRVQFGIFRGLQFGVLLRPMESPEVFLAGVGVRQTPLSQEHRGPRAIMNALERLANSYQEQCDSLQSELVLAENQLRDYQTRLGLPFVHEAYLTELSRLRDGLKAGLSHCADDSAEGEATSTAELAEHIKRLKAENTIEAAMRRTAATSKPSTTESTAFRARRRVMPMPATIKSETQNAANASAVDRSFDGKQPSEASSLGEESSMVVENRTDTAEVETFLGNGDLQSYRLPPRQLTLF